VVPRNWDKPQHVLETLGDLGFTVPAPVHLAASRGAKVAFAVHLHQLDHALKASTLKTAQRIAFKLAADRFWLFAVRTITMGKAKPGLHVVEAPDQLTIISSQCCFRSTKRPST
jgi:hypothetical protein